MKALMFAAGKGSRISRQVEGKPKCTLDIGGMPLIEYTVKLLNDKGISDIAIVLGYEYGIVEDVLKSYNIKFYYNYFYDITNSIASAWMAREFLKDDDFIIMNADVFLEYSLLDKILEEKRNPVLFADNTRKDEADYKFYYENNILIKYGKELKDDDITGEYIGVAKLGKGYIFKFLNQLNDMISKSTHGVWWENILYELSHIEPVYVVDIEGMFWGEIDYIEDYQRILNFTKKKM